MWCASVSLSVWANAWLAGRAAPDDVLDALTAWAPAHLLTAHDAVAASRWAGLPFPDADPGGSVALLAALRGATAGIAVLTPAPGDVRGLPPGTPFARAALAAGEAVIATGPDGTVGLVPSDDEAGDDNGEAEADRDVTVLRWTAYVLPGALPGTDPAPELGAAEYELRSAVRTAAEALAALDLGAMAGTDPRAAVARAVDELRGHRIPEHAPDRAVRVLDQAAHVDAILAVAAGPVPLTAVSGSQARLSDATLQPLAAVVRTARLAALAAILRSAWR